VSGSFVSPETRTRIKHLAEPLALALGRLGLTPNALTVIGFVGTCVAALAAALQAWLPAGVLVLAFGIFDMFDGTLARATGRASKFGAFLDSTLDRTGENLVLAGVVAGCLAGGAFPLGGVLAALALALASVVTYTRARAESVGVHGEVGVAPRPERLVVLAAGLILAGWSGGVGLFAPLRPADVMTLPGDAILVLASGQPWLALALATIVVTSAITILQRIVHVKRQLDHPQPQSSKE